MSSYISLKLVTSTKYHLWTDTLHARELASTTTDDWNRGTYVRWTVIFAVTTLEMCCREALEEGNIGHRFKEDINKAISEKAYSPIEWGRDTWQKVTSLREERHKYIHLNEDQSELWPELENANRAINIVREAVKDIYHRANKQHPSWIDDDAETGFK